MWPAVPRIIATTLLPSLLLPELEGSKGPSIGEMLGEEFTQQALMRAGRGVVERDASVAGEEAAERVACVCRQHAAGRGDAAAALAKGSPRDVAEAHRCIGCKRHMALTAHIDRRRT